jgi:hypothetical protein
MGLLVMRYVQLDDKALTQTGERERGVFGHYCAFVMVVVE